MGFKRWRFGESNSAGGEVMQSEVRRYIVVGCEVLSMD